MRLMQRLAISGLLSVILIVLLTGTFVTRRDLASVVERGVAPEERNEQLSPAWVQNNMVPGQEEARSPEDKDRRVDPRHRQSEPSSVGSPPVPVPGPYAVRPPNPPLDDVTNQRREKIKEMMKHGWDNYVRYAWGKNELRPISKRGHSASIFGASNMGATIVDGLDTLYIMGLHDEFKQGRDWIAENLDFDIRLSLVQKRFNFDEEMRFVRRYHDINRILLLSIGLEHTKNKTLQRVQRIFIIGLFVAFMAIQVKNLTDVWYNLNTFIETLCYVLPFLGFLGQYMAVFVNTKTVLELQKRIKYDRLELNNDEEAKIMERYDDISLLYTIVCALIFYGILIAELFLQVIPYFLDIFLPLNESRELPLALIARASFGEQEYAGIMRIFVNINLIIGATIALTTSSLHVTFMQHGCGLFKVVSFRIQRAFDNDTLVVPASKRSSLICLRMKHAIKMHNRALDYCHYFKSAFILSHLILLCIAISCLTVHLFYLLQTIMLRGKLSDYLTSMALVYGDFHFLFLANYAGQSIIDHSDDVFKDVCNVQWYEVPTNVQKILLIVLVRSMKSSTLILGGMFVLCLEGFATATSTSVSYFTVIYSLRL